MISDLYLSLMNSNRAQEKNLYAYSYGHEKNSQIYNSIHDDLLVFCDSHGLKRQTKFLIKKSLDIYILKFPRSPSDQISFVAIILFRMAIKFNQDPLIYDRITEEQCMHYVNNRYSLEDFRNYELQFYGLPEFNMSFTTPYDYLGLIVDIFSINAKDYNKILMVLDLSYTIEKLMFNTAEEILFGCLLCVFEKNTTLKSWIISQSFSKQESEKAFQLIKHLLQSLLEAEKNAQIQ